MDGTLVGPEELVGRLGEVTVLDVRWALGRPDGRQDYLDGHVPGAAFVDLGADLADPVGDGSRGRHPLPGPERFGAAMRRCGVHPDRTVVVYDDAWGTSAARAWWLLRHHGHPDVRLLDGGWGWWRREGRPVAAGEVTTEPGSFEPGPGTLPVLGAEQAAALAGSGILVDARSPERFRGEVEPVDPVAGHVPGAVNVPVTANLEPDGSDRAGRFSPVEALAREYDAVGARDPEVAVGVYCGSGVSATHDVFALHLLGVRAALFAGSWSAWVADPDRPVATGSEG